MRTSTEAGDKAVTKEIATVKPRDESPLEIPVTASSTGSAASMQIRDRIKELRRVKAKDLLVNPKNWRRHPKAQADALRGLLGEIGYADALLARALADGRLMLIDGHLRVETTPDAEVPVLVLDVSEEEADKLLLTLDPLAAMAEADSERIKALLETVRTDNAAVQELMRRTAGERLWAVLHPDELNEAEISPARADELRRKWNTEIGQLWCTDRHRIICADCTDQTEVTRLWREERARARLIWTDPPYGVSYADKNKFLNASDRGNRIQRKIVNDHLTPEETEALFTAALSTAVAHCEPGAALYATVPGGPLQARFMRALEAAGFSFKAGLVWVKNQFVLGMSDYHYRHESILYGWLETGPHYFTPDRTQDSVFEVNKPHVSEHHATCKPVALISQMIANSSRPAEFIYDPFCGSGSTIVAAHQLGRVGYGCEIDPEYVAVTLERLSLLGLKPELVSKS